MMAVATEATSAYLHAPSAQNTFSQSGSIDSNLLLHDAAVTAASQSAGTNVEGGSWAEVYIRCGTITDADETLIVTVEVRVDGTNWLDYIRFPTFTDATMDNDEISRPVFIPRDTQASAGKGRVDVRLDFVTAGTTPSFPIEAYLRPLGYGENPPIAKLTT